MKARSWMRVLLAALALAVGTTWPAAAGQRVTLSATLAEPKDRWDILIEGAKGVLQKRHPELEIEVSYEVLPYAETRSKLLTMMAGRTPRDLVSVDAIWLGEFAEGGFLRDISPQVATWARMDEWYAQNRDGSQYGGRYYGVWAWTDVRVLWYWKDLLAQAGVNPNQLATWDGYVAACQTLNRTLRPRGIEGCHLVGAPHSPDMWFPYLWMLGGKLLELRDGHPSKGTYWYPAFHSPAGVRAMEFLRQQVRAGIRPQVDHFWGQEFAQRRFAVMLEGSWLLGHFPSGFPVEEQVGILPAFPVPQADTPTATMMGGWVLSIPATSRNPDLAWELVSIMLDPEVLTPMLASKGYLPTQRTIAETSPYRERLAESVPYFAELSKALPFGFGRPNIPEYPQVAEALRVGIEAVYYGQKSPDRALRDAAEQAARALGWPGLVDG